VGYQPGMDLSKYWKGFEPEAGKQTAEFWHNGTAHKNRVQGNTFLQSVMHDRGLQCTNCHQSHGSLYRSLNVKSGETNALCLTCHGPGKSIGPKYRTLDEHTHHAPLSLGSRCIECHMTKTGQNSVRAEARNHTFEFISPAETIRSADPNSCNTCHADKTAPWALDYVKKWYPKSE
jgi:predicted CXXCH cytochrome family protein